MVLVVTVTVLGTEGSESWSLIGHIEGDVIAVALGTEDTACGLKVFVRNLNKKAHMVVQGSYAGTGSPSRPSMISSAGAFPLRPSAAAASDWSSL